MRLQDAGIEKQADTTAESCRRAVWSQVLQRAGLSWRADCMTCLDMVSRYCSLALNQGCSMMTVVHGSVYRDLGKLADLQACSALG